MARIMSLTLHARGGGARSLPVNLDPAVAQQSVCSGDQRRLSGTIKVTHIKSCIQLGNVHRRARGSRCRLAADAPRTRYRCLSNAAAVLELPFNVAR